MIDIRNQFLFQDYLKISIWSCDYNWYP